MMRGIKFVIDETIPDGEAVFVLNEKEVIRIINIDCKEG